VTSLDVGAVAVMEEFPLDNDVLDDNVAPLVEDALVLGNRVVFEVSVVRGIPGVVVGIGTKPSLYLSWKW
jgi:hypothetical protein